jgi:protein-tyrosine-phosphatase
MAAGILRSLLGDEPGWRIGSAGTWAVEGMPVVPEVLEIMGRRGVDLSRHRARQVAPQLLAISRLVLVMEPGQQEAIQSEFTDLAGAVFLLSEMSGIWQPVADPVGGALKDFEATAVELESLIAAGMERIRFLSKE